MRKILLVTMVALAGVLPACLGPCCLFEAYMLSDNINWCNIINCEGTPLWDPCAGEITLQDCAGNGAGGGQTGT